MNIIDIHTHIYPDKIAQKATDSIRQFYDLEGGHMDGTTDSLIRRSQDAGIDRQVILPVAIRPDHVQEVARFPQLDLTGAQFEQIAWKTAAHVLRL